MSQKLNAKPDFRLLAPGTTAKTGAEHMQWQKGQAKEVTDETEAPCSLKNVKGNGHSDGPVIRLEQSVTE